MPEALYDHLPDTRDPDDRSLGIVLVSSLLAPFVDTSDSSPVISSLFHQRIGLETECTIFRMPWSICRRQCRQTRRKTRVCFTGTCTMTPSTTLPGNDAHSTVHRPETSANHPVSNAHCGYLISCRAPWSRSFALFPARADAKSVSSSYYRAAGPR